MVSRQPGLFQSDQGNRRVPDRRDTGLQAQGFSLFDFIPSELANFPGGQGIVGRIPQRYQRKDGVHHRGIDGPQSIAALEMLKQPALCLPQRALSQRLPRHALVKFQSTIKRQEEISPGKKMIAPGKCSSPNPGVAEEFVDAHGLAQFPVACEHKEWPGG